MRVVLLVTDLERGGTPLRLASLARGLRRAGVDVHVGCLAPPGPVSEQLEADAIPTFACSARSVLDLPAVFRLAGHLRRLRPDLVHATLAHANLVARLVGDLLGIPVVSSTATIEVERRWQRIAERCTSAMDRGQIVASRTLAAHVAQVFRVPADRIYIVPPALPAPPRRVERQAARRRFDLAPDGLVVLWAGRFDPVKRLDVVIGCVERIERPPCHLLLAGDGPARPQVERIARASRARARVHLLGWLDDLGPALGAADLFLFPSRTEGLPNAVLQAMACGLPVVGSDIPALRELAGPERRLLLVGGDDPRDYARAVRSLAARPELRREIGQRAAAWARRHLDPERTVRATLAVYERVLRGWPE